MENVIYIRVAAPQEYVNTYATRRVWETERRGGQGVTKLDRLLAQQQLKTTPKRKTKLSSAEAAMHLQRFNV